MAASCTLYPELLPQRVRQDPKLSAEVRMYDLLKEQLGFGWTVFYDVAWLGLTHPDQGPRDGQIDFVVAHPKKGVLLVEVKGGRIRFDGPSQQWISKDRHGVDHEIAPFAQVRSSKYGLLNKLKTLPSLDPGVTAILRRLGPICRSRSQAIYEATGVLFLEGRSESDRQRPELRS